MHGRKTERERRESPGVASLLSASHPYIAKLDSRMPDTLRYKQAWLGYKFSETTDHEEARLEIYALLIHIILGNPTRTGKEISFHS